MSLPAETQPPRFRIAPPGPTPGVAATGVAQQPAAALKPFAPVVENKEVELKFTIALEHACFLFDGGKRPKDKGADWKPSHAIASWASWSTKKDKAGHEEVVTTANAPFARKEAARIEMCRESAASALQVKWCDAAASAAEIKKKLKQKPGGNALEDQIIQISLFAANQDFYKPKDGCAAAPKPPTQTCDERSKPIVLGAPFLLNLSVRRLLIRVLPACV
jgi:hypothetical protein